MSDPVRLPLPSPRRSGDADWHAEVVHADRFGNLITNLTRSHLDEALSPFQGDPTALVAVVEGAVLPLVRTYSDVGAGEPCALLGSAGRLEIAVNGGSAAALLGALRGTPVRLRAASPPER